VERGLLPGEYAVLGALSVRAMHGYEMQCFLADEGLTDVIPMEPSTLYTYLRNVELRGLVSWAEERVGQRPPRKTYALTAAGAQLLTDWLHRPVDRMRAVRGEFLLKLYFTGLRDARAHRALLAAQIASCERYLAGLDARAADTAFRRLVTQSKRSAAEGTLHWLTGHLADLDRGTLAT
jgi:PadR family transcriptional regulator AphA